MPKKLRTAMSKLRLSSHKLHIETGRYGRNRVDRAQRRCNVCNSLDIEDEYHFILICPVYVQYRNEYIKPYYIRHPSMFKFIDLLKTKNKTVMKNLCKFISEAFMLRNTLVNNVT